MKKRYLILAGLLVMTVAAAGCGKKKTTETAPVEVTATPTPEVTKAVDMVDMQQTADEDIKNIMGEKTSTASKIVFVNNTGDDIQSLYIRTHVDEDSEDYDADEDGGWGDDLINGMFTLTDKDKALYYMQTANTQTANTQTSGTQTTSNKSTASYDIRIAYTDEDKNECFFRDIPLGTISQITLCMDGTDDDAIPYAKYLTGTSTKEVSTLDAVKERLGITDDSKSESDSTDDSDKNSTDNSDSADNNNSGDQNTDDSESESDSTDDSDKNSADDSDSTDSNNSSDQNNNSGNGTGDSSDDPGNGGNSDDPGTNDDPGSNDDPGNGGDMISTAEQYIGQPLDALEGACGSPQGSSYEDDPETGKTGFHYYSNFTVSTTVDENGNEIVAGIW